MINPISMLKGVGKTALPWLMQRAPEILTGIGMLSTAGAVIEAVHATVKTTKKVEEEELSIKEDPKTFVKEIAPIYIPTLALTCIAEGCIFGSLKASMRKAAALMTMYQIADQNTDKLVDILDGKAEENDKKPNTELECERLNTPWAPGPWSWPKAYIKDEITGQFFWGLPDEIERVANRLSKNLYSGQDWLLMQEFLLEIGEEQCREGDTLAFTPQDPICVEFDSAGVTSGYPYQPYLIMRYVNDPVHITELSNV